MPLTPEQHLTVRRAGMVLKTDTLKSLRLEAGLTEKAMAGELGIKLYHLQNMEAGEWPTKFATMKAAAQIVRIMLLFGKS